MGIRQLKQELSKILHRVRQKGDIIEIAYHGEVIVRLVPVVPPEPPGKESAAVGHNRIS